MSLSLSCNSAQFAEVNAITLDGPATSSICATIDVGTVGATVAVLQWTVKRIRTAEQRATEIEYGLDTNFLLNSAYQVT
jgi:hypothetical protein